MANKAVIQDMTKVSSDLPQHSMSILFHVTTNTLAEITGLGYFDDYPVGEEGKLILVIRNTLNSAGTAVTGKTGYFVFARKNATGDDKGRVQAAVFVPDADGQALPGTYDS